MTERLTLTEKVAADTKKIAGELDYAANQDPNAPKILREMLAELEEGLPRATSAEVLGKRCAW